MGGGTEVSWSVLTVMFFPQLNDMEQSEVRAKPGSTKNSQEKNSRKLFGNINLRSARKNAIYGRIHAEKYWGFHSQITR